MTRKKVAIIGSGFAGLSAAAMLAKQGNEVIVLEKNSQPGGRARTWERDGFVFDMGPSWYWMPEVYEDFYKLFGKTTSDFYELKRLYPSYRVYYPGNDKMDVPASKKQLLAMFEEREPGSAKKLEKFLENAEYKYNTAMQEYVHRVSDSVAEFLDVKLLFKSLQIQIFQSLRSEVRSKFTNPALVSLLEFPVLFLGSTPQNTPAMYSMMNYADLVLGTWYPMGGMSKVVDAFVSIAESQGVKILLNHAVEKIEIRKGQAKRVLAGGNWFEADIIVAGSDYNHTEQMLLDKPYRAYDNTYWENRTMSPSSLLFYLGVNKKVKNLLHHNLFFDADFDQHANEIYDTPKWPTQPLFYACVPSKTDTGVAPDGMENIFLLMPLAPGIEDSEQLREEYFTRMMERLEARTGENVSAHIVVKRSYCIKDFERDYNSYKGNAYGLANTLSQTAVFKPKMISPKVKNLFYTGQLTVPGPGVPPAIISGQIVAGEIEKRITNHLL